MGLSSENCFEERIAVVDDENKFMSYTHPARVRKLLKQGKAEIFSQDPFTIRLKGGGVQMQPRVARPVIVSFTDYFRGEERDIYVQNIGNTIVSMQFETSPGHMEYVPIPNDRNPINLTNFVSFNAIKNGSDFRKLVNRHPPVLRLMTSEEYAQYYQKRAELNRSSVEDEISKADEIHRRFMNRQKEEGEAAKTVDQLRKDAEKAVAKEGAKADYILPRIVGMCEALGPDAKERPSAETVLSEVEGLFEAGQIKDNELEYLQGHGYYKTVKKWAQERFSDLHGEPASEE